MNSYRNSLFSGIPPITKNIIAINIIMWLATWALPDFFVRWGLNVDLTSVLGLHYWEASKFNPAQLVTYAFMHANFWHLFFNMLTLYMFGSILEQLWGSKRFLYYYFITAIGAGLVQELIWTIEFQPMINEAVTSQSLVNISITDFLNKFITIGASGSVFGLLLAFGWLFPEQRIYIYFIPVKARIGVIIFAVAELFFGVANFSFDSIAHFAHLGGMLFGAIMILIWKKRR